MVFDADQAPLREGLVDPSGRVGDDQPCATEQGKHARREDDLG